MSYKTNESFDAKYDSLLNIPELSKKDSYVAKFTISTTLIMYENLKEFLNNNVAHSVFIRLIKGIDHNKVAYGVVVTVILMILEKLKDKNNSFYLPEDLMTISDMQYLESYSYKCQGSIDTVEKLEKLMVVVSEIEKLDIFKRYSDICYKVVSERYTFENYTLLFEKGTIGEDFKEFSCNYPYRFHLIIAVKFKDKLREFSDYTKNDLVSFIGINPEIKEINSFNAPRSKHLKDAGKGCLQTFLFLGGIIVLFFIFIVGG